MFSIDSDENSLFYLTFQFLFAKQNRTRTIINKSKKTISANDWIINRCSRSKVYNNYNLYFTHVYHSYIIQPIHPLWNLIFCRTLKRTKIITRIIAFFSYLVLLWVIGHCDSPFSNSGLHILYMIYHCAKNR